MTDNYRSAPGINYSSLKLIDKSPLHYKHNIENPPPDRKVFQVGRAIHCAVLEPEKFRDEYVIMPATIKKRAGKAWEEFKAENEGREIVSVAERDKYVSIAKSIKKNPHTRRLLARKTTKCEVPIFWTYRGHEMKSQIDFLGPNMMGDLKSTADILPRKFDRSVVNYEYLAQFAFYQMAHETQIGKRVPFYCFAVEKEAPFDVCPVLIPDDALDYGRKKIDDWIDKLEACNESGEWPGVGGGEIREFALPMWAQEDTDDLVIGE